MSELVYDTDVPGVMVTLTPTVSVTLVTPTVSVTLAALPESPTVSDVSGVPIDSPTVSDVSGVTDILAALPDTPTVSDVSGVTLERVSTFVWCMRLIWKCLRPRRQLASHPPIMHD